LVYLFGELKWPLKCKLIVGQGVRPFHDIRVLGVVKLENKIKLFFYFLGVGRGKEEGNLKKKKKIIKLGNDEVVMNCL